ncbi:hypothetical protein Terro_0709 [Terriglobus roseus DSM 18391]|uniref:Ferritin-like domain-containing protein n=1 Tax=Terriglobus roseus (strain DSM 18391 / NRRL B-41598 / KBS 63) TaxID=926566 RepID=I3ZCS6_TERRK|nr:ferritin-like domain-containing protein [Terriglobus roseus]AFL87044.1 hypothetical protein Terro_0709 [Terriglobus roseus DSM 18391]
MATLETQKVDAIIASRRALLMGGGALAALALAPGVAKAAIPAAPTDNDILNFALNLEYLEAQFYTLATEGVYADKSTKGSAIATGAGTATGGSTSTTVVTKANASGTASNAIAPVPFTSAFVAAYAFETALEERRHVNFLRGVLGSNAVAQPTMDLLNSFYSLGSLLNPAISNYDPFANDLNFLLGAFIFEDVGVTAYHGAAGLITDTKSYLTPAAAIHAVEAYHAGLIRSTLYGIDQGYITIPGETRKGAAAYASQIAGARATFDGTGGTTSSDDVGITTKQVALNTATANLTSSTIVNADANYIGFGRTPRQVLNIVYAATGAPTKGGFFPNGLNGNIS